MKGRLMLGVAAAALVCGVMAATGGAAESAPRCTSPAGPNACLALTKAPFLSAAQAMQVVGALWAARERDRVRRATSYAGIETGSAELTDDTVIDDVRCGCGTYPWTRSARQLRGVSLYLPRLQTYPLYFMAAVSSNIPGAIKKLPGAVTAVLIFTRRSPTTPWRIAVQVFDNAYAQGGLFVPPDAGTDMYELPASNPPASATRSWFPKYVAYMNEVKKTGRQPASSPFAPGKLTSGNGLEARPNGFKSNGSRATYTFKLGHYGGPWVFNTVVGTMVCGDVMEYARQTPLAGELLLQTPNRGNWGWDLRPGLYSSITTVHEWPICITRGPGSKLNVGGNNYAGYPMHTYGVRVGSLR